MVLKAHMDMFFLHFKDFFFDFNMTNKLTFLLMESDLL
jgi:hypothetical protein